MDRKRLINRAHFLGALLLLGCGALHAENPIIRHMYTADPSAHVWSDGRLYLYPSTDIAPPKGCDRMDQYHVFSTDDMIHWTDHGEILRASQVPWGRKGGGFMFAPDCAYKNGTYYYYFPHPSGENHKDSWKIGVATSQSPTANFEVKGYIPGLDPLIDPSVFIDDDGQAYFYYGGGRICKGGKLKDNMMEIDGSMQDMLGLDDFHEGTWVFKRKGLYYLVYPDRYNAPEPGLKGNRMQYAISDNPLGPWKSKGVILEPTGCNTMHGSIVEYKNHWYLFYHTKALSGVSSLRSVCFEPIEFNEDGTIQKIVRTGNETLTLYWPLFFSESQMKGKFVPFALGNYKAADLQKLGAEIQPSSSFQVPPGYIVELYTEEAFQGKKVTVTSDCPELKSFGLEGRVASIQVKRSLLSKLIEAESAKISDKQRITKNAAASGGQAVDGMNKEGAFVEFERVNGGRGGEMILNVVYSSGGGGEGGVGFVVNGQEAGWFACPKSGSYDNYQGNIRYPITLKPGAENVIKLVGGTGGLNVDYIMVTPK